MKYIIILHLYAFLTSLFNNYIGMRIENFVDHIFMTCHPYTPLCFVEIMVYWLSYYTHSEVADFVMNNS